jgi:ribosome-binding protein aMBF1 (putative translation factor)
MMAARKRKTVSAYVAERRARDMEFAEEFDKLQLARQMRELREKAGLSQAQLAARVGTQAPGIARIESGRFAPRLDVLHRIAAALGKRVRIQFDAAGARRSNQRG